MTPCARSNAARPHVSTPTLNTLSRLPVTFGLIGACVAVYLAVAIAGQAYGYPLNVGLVTQPSEVLARGAIVRLKLPVAVAARR